MLRTIRALFLLAAFGSIPHAAWAVPSFARQTNLPCNTCHTVAFGPALTQFGRQFKLSGYTLGEEGGLPLSAMAVASFTSTAKKLPENPARSYDNNNNAALDEFSLFYGGRVAGKVGAFAQVTYSGIDHRTSWDNLDIRFADTGSLFGQSLTYGVSLNNNPTVQDLWNSSPAWSFPYVGSDLAPTPTAAPVLEEAFAQQVLGLTGYSMLNGWLYLEGGAYGQLSNNTQSALGIEDPASEDRVASLAPYGRIAAQGAWGSHQYSVGLIGFAPRVHPGGDSSAGSDRFTDYGLDASYQFVNGGPNLFLGNASFIHEAQNRHASVALGGAANRNDSLDVLRLNGSWVYQQTYSLSAGTFFISGKRDAVLYAPDAVDGSANGKPDSTGYILQGELVPFGKPDSLDRPWTNLRLGLQYTGYTKVNGGSSNYDGAGRNASDNNTLFLFLWLAV